MDDMNYFKQSFKYFKRNRGKEILNSVIDIETNNVPEWATLVQDIAIGNACDECMNLGLRPHQEWYVYKFKSLDGFYYIRNPFARHGQQHWVQKCLSEYTRKPAVTNLDIHHDRLDDIWASYHAGESKLMDKLAWVTLGYHYDWDRKIYERSKYSPFPTCLRELAKHVARCLNFKTFEPDTAILNYYNLKSTLGIHNDHSEEVPDEPIVAFSFGLTAIFLMGTEQPQEKPLPLLLKSGDIVLMSGASRFAYHAVPAVLNTYDCSWDDSPFSNYIKQHRINISVRQVYYPMSSTVHH